MSRPGRVEVYRSPAHRHRRIDCDGDCAPSPDIVGHGPGFHIQGFMGPEWRWRRFAANGLLIGGSTQGYDRLRDLSYNLEQSFPGYRLLDQDCDLTGPTWWLYGMEFAHPGCAADIAIPEDTVMGVGMRGVRIPVTVPAGVWLGSRR